MVRSRHDYTSYPDLPELLSPSSIAVTSDDVSRLHRLLLIVVSFNSSLVRGKVLVVRLGRRVCLRMVRGALMLVIR